MEKEIPRRVAWAGAFVLAAVVYLTYQPGLTIGFYLDDYLYLERAGRTNWSNALAQFFDPSLQIVWYRPVQAIQFFFELHLFGGSADAYHLINISFHAINVLLLYAIAWRLSKQWRLGWLSGLFYATFSVFPSAINWVGIIDPLASLFYLLSVWFWLGYLEHGTRRGYVLTAACFVFALLSKQVAVTIPIILFLIEWWLLQRPISGRRLVQRYAPYAAGIVGFLLLQYSTPSTHTMIGVFGWQIGAKMAFTLAQYLVLFFFPYSEQPSIDINQPAVGTPLSYLWMFIAVALLAQVAWRTKSRPLFFLVVFAMLNLLPVLPFPFIEHRYLYLPLMAGAVILTLLFRRAWERYRSRRVFVGGAALGLALLALDNGLSINTSAVATAQWVSGLRVPFQEIERQHPTLPPNALLYFVDPVVPTKGGLGGMAMLRYGPGVWVKDWTEPAEFDKYDAVHVYYFDTTSSPRDVIGERNVWTHLSRSLPVDFQSGIRLDGYEVPRARLRRDEPMILVLYWRATQTIRRDYALYAHLIAPNGELVASYEGPPRRGQLPTLAWEVERFTSDAILLPVDAKVRTGGGYRIEIGWWDAITRQRDPMLDTQGQPLNDGLLLESFTVEP